MAISSINFKAVKSNSEAHHFISDKRKELDYVYSELTDNNDSWSISSISDMDRKLRNDHKTLTGRKMSKSATPIREAVVNLNQEHTNRIHVHQQFLLAQFEVNWHSIFPIDQSKPPK